MLIAVLLTGSHAFAHDFDVDGIYYNILSETDKTVEVTYKGNSSTSYIEYSGSKIIPEKLVYNGDTYSVTSISKSAFSGCNSLTSVTIPNSVTRIGDGAFEGCSKLAKITIPNSVISIGVNVSKDCSKLTSIIVESGNTIYDSRDNCNAIIQTTTNTLITGCKTTIIPNSVTKIGQGAFRNCSSLTSITIPNSVKIIEQTAFYNCSGLTNVTIPNSVTSIGNYAFYNCSGLTEIICENSIPATVESTTFYNITATLYVPVGAREAYASATGWNHFTNIIEDDVKTGVESILAEDVNVSVENGNIVINGVDNANIEVYSTNGQCVYNVTATTIPVSSKGLYIVKVDNKSFKVTL